MVNSLQIAIDGPVGAGKSDISLALSRTLGITFVYTGAMYRALAYVCLTRGIPLADEQRITQTLGTISIGLEPTSPGSQFTVKVTVDGQDVTAALFEPTVDAAVPYVSRIADVRKIMVRRQQEIAAEKSVVMEGRDIGLRVLPHAQLKIYLTATVEERAKRRMDQLKSKGIDKPFGEVLEDTRQRDTMDMTRETDPLVKLPDAWELDTTGMSKDEVIDAIRGELSRRNLL